MEAYKQYISLPGAGRGWGATQKPQWEEWKSEKDSGPPGFRKEPVLLLHVTSVAADLGLTLLDFCHLPPYMHGGDKKHGNFHCKFTTVTEMAQTCTVFPLCWFVSLILPFTSFYGSYLLLSLIVTL